MTGKRVGIQSVAQPENRNRAPGDEHESGRSAESPDLNEVIHSADHWIREQMEVRPYQAVAAAAAVGYLLGRGIASPFGRMLLMGAARMALTEAWTSGRLKDGFDRMVHSNT